jgi:hypothetical protein
MIFECIALNVTELSFFLNVHLHCSGLMSTYFSIIIEYNTMINGFLCCSYYAPSFPVPCRLRDVTVVDIRKHLQLLSNHAMSSCFDLVLRPDLCLTETNLLLVRLSCVMAVCCFHDHFVMVGRLRPWPQG